MQSYTLHELNTFIRRVIALNLEESVWIQCEIAQCNESRGHYWLELIQKGEEESDDIIAQAPAVIWSSQYRKLKKNLGKVLTALLKDGIEVKIKARVDFSERFGLKLIIEDIDPTFTLGKLALQRQAIIERLREEALLAKNGQLPLPRVLQKIAVISSENAAGFQDFKNQLANNPYAYQFKLDFFPSAMQGIKVEEEMLAQLKKIKRRAKNYDAVAILRGGGARLDLRAFDNYALAKSIAELPIPVLIGIGHDIDETVLDLVAHQSLKTPTALADFIIHNNEYFEVQLQQYALLIQKQTIHAFQTQSILLERLNQEVSLLSKQQIQLAKTSLQNLEARLRILYQLPLQVEKNKLDRMELLTQLLDQKNLLDRGFAIVSKENGDPIRNIDQVSEEELVRIQLSKGQLMAIIKEKQ